MSLPVIDVWRWLNTGETNGLSFGSTTPDDVQRIVGKADEYDHPSSPLDDLGAGFSLLHYSDSEFCFLNKSKVLSSVKFANLRWLVGCVGGRSVHAGDEILKLGECEVRLGDLNFGTFDRMTSLIANLSQKDWMFSMDASVEDRLVSFWRNFDDRELLLTYELETRPVDDGLFDIDYFLEYVRLSDQSVY